jgi:hypothetical protein
MLPCRVRDATTEKIKTEANYLKKGKMFGYTELKTGANSMHPIKASSKCPLILHSFLVMGRLYTSIYLYMRI